MSQDNWDDAGKALETSEKLILNIEGYEGPLDVLLDLARSQKVDLLQISILQLVEQYLGFIERARAMRLELAADYLVMASWLTYLKSRLLLPEEPKEEGEMSAEEMAAILSMRLKKLSAMRDAAEALFARPRLGLAVFQRGQPEVTRIAASHTWKADYNELLKAYARQRQAMAVGQVRFERPPLVNLAEAREWLERFLKIRIDWQSLSSFVVLYTETDAPARSVYASGFLAALELVREGKLDIQQSGPYAPIYLKARS